jgi:hypothetical protein
VQAHDINGETALDFVWFRRSLDQYSLAEGATGTFFDLDLAIANPNPVEAPVDITFLTPSGTTVQQARVLPPASRTTIKVDEIPGLEGAEVSTVVRQTSSPTQSRCRRRRGSTRRARRARSSRRSCCSRIPTIRRRR